MTDTWAYFFLRIPSMCPVRETAPKLKWLGIPDFRDVSLVAPRILLDNFLPLCTNLQTLSIRGKYREEIPPPSLSGHEYVCDFIRGIKTRTPSSVTALELRLSIPFLHQLLVALHAEDRLNIDQIGLGLGAWAQIYPLRNTSTEISDSDIISAASKAASKARFDIYEQQHNKLLSASSRWLLPAPEDTPNMSDVSSSSGSPAFERLDARPTFQNEPYKAKGGSDIRNYTCDRSKLESRKKCGNKDENHHKELLGSLERTHVNSLPSMLVKLHDAGRIAASQDYSLYSLNPEWQVNSTIPLHPFTMIQKYQPVPTLSMDQGRDYKQLTADRLKEAYTWLNATFAWRPIFDWDYFVSCGMESPKENLDVAFSSLEQQYKLGNTTRSTNEVLLGEVSRQFQIMRDAGIPIHLLMGRRNPDESSLYWGWPYNSDAWEKSLKAPLDAGLGTIAAHIDTLSIFYDLRNPLDEQRLEEIDKRQPYRRPEAYCPRPNGPWHLAKNSPFKKQWQHRPSRISKRNTQKTANKKIIGKKTRIPLANNLDSCPPAGEYADEHLYDDPETDRSIPETLHQVARRAAFEREAVGWHRFWTEYAPQMTNLKELRLRMPQNFDSVGSWSLRQLLNPKETWVMFGYADERGHMQTQEDLLHHVANDFRLHMHAAQEKIWPGGRFVRRSWILWTPEPTGTAELALHRGTNEARCPTSHPSSSNKTTDLYKTHKLAGDRREKEQLQKAIKQARETARKEEELEASLLLSSSEDLVRDPPAVIPRSEDIERRLTGIYGRHVRGIAQRTWRAEMRGHIEQLNEDVHGRDETVHSLRRVGAVSQVEDATIARNILRDTRELLLKRMHDFRPEDIFVPCDCTEHTNGLELVNHMTDYAAEERKRRGEPVQEDAHRTEKPTSRFPSTNTRPGALPRGPQHSRTSPIENSSGKSSSESTSSDEDDPWLTRFTPAMQIKRITATQTTTAQQGSEAIYTTRKLELAQQSASDIATGQNERIPKFERKPNKESNESDRAAHQTSEDVGFTQSTVKGRGTEEKGRFEEQAVEKKRLIEEKKAAIATAEAEKEARIAAENKVVQEKKKRDGAKSQNAEIRRQVEEVGAAAKKLAADEKAAKEEAKQKTEHVKKKAAAEKKELMKQADAERKKVKDAIAAEKKRTADNEAARKEAEQKAADETAEATEIAAVKAKEAAATIKAVNNEGTLDIVPTIEGILPGKPTEKPTKSPKTSKEKSSKILKGTKRKQPSPDPFEDDAVDEREPVKKPRPNKGASTTSTPVRRSARLRTQTPTKTPTPQLEFPSDVSVTKNSENYIEDDGKRKKSKKGKKDVDDYKPPGSTKKRTPTKVAKAARERAMGSKAVTLAKGRKRAADEEEEEIEEITKKKPTQKSVKTPPKKKVKKADGDDNEL